MNPHDRIDFTRCVIVKPGDVLILSGIRDLDPTTLGASMDELRQALGLRHILVCEDEVQVTIRDVNTELAKQEEQLKTYSMLFEEQRKQHNKTLDLLDATRRELAEVRLTATN